MSKSSVIAALAKIIQLLDKLESDGVNPSDIAKLRRETIFFLYEGGNKHKWNSERPHSKGARELLRAVENGAMRKSDARHLCTYEHSVPISSLKVGLNAAAASAEELEIYLDRHVLGVVVLRSEDALLRAAKVSRSLPAGSAANDRLARYQAVGIELEPQDRLKIEKGWSIPC
jgi:hypothetical protein